MRQALALVLFVVPACGGARQTRTVSAPVIDEHTGTVYAVEVDDTAGPWGDSTVVIICNEAMADVCYRIRPRDALSEENARAVQQGLRELRRRTEAE